MIVRSEKEVDALIADLIARTKGRHINQGVAFSKTCPRQLRLLKMALMESNSFSGLIKEVLALRYASTPPSSQQQNSDTGIVAKISDKESETKIKAKKAWLE